MTMLSGMIVLCPCVVIIVNIALITMISITFIFTIINIPSEQVFFVMLPVV